jgi:hypothetical protein
LIQVSRGQPALQHVDELNTNQGKRSAKEVLRDIDKNLSLYDERYRIKRQFNRNGDVKKG